MGHQTVSATIEHCKRFVEGRNRRPLERLDGVVTTTATTITLEFGDRNITNGTYIEIDEEILYIFDSATLGVLRGQQSTSAAQHADDSIVTIEPRFGRQFILEEMEHVIATLPENVFAVTTVDVTFSADQPHAELVGASGQDVLWAIAERDPDPSAKDPYLRPLLRVIENDAVTSGWIVQIEHGASYQTGQTLEVTYAHTFDLSTFTTATNLTDDVGIPESLVPAIEHGTIAQVLMSEEVARNTVQSQAMPRRSEEVPPGVMLEVANWWYEKFERGVAAEAARLRRKYPILETA